MAFVRVARVSDVPPGRVVVVGAEGQEVAVCNVDGQFHALANICTHDEGPLGSGYLDGNEIECPRHGARFDVRTGAVKSLPAIVPVPTFQVQIQDSAIWVDVG